MKISLEYINGVAGSDHKFREQLIDIMCSDLKDELEIFESSIELNKLKEAAEIIHKTKHKISMLRLDDFHNFILNFEENIKNNHLSEKEKNKYIQGLNEVINKLMTH